MKLSVDMLNVKHKPMLNVKLNALKNDDVN
jgi:hypothetical protein